MKRCEAELKMISSRGCNFGIFCYWYLVKENVDFNLCDSNFTKIYEYAIYESIGGPTKRLTSFPLVVRVCRRECLVKGEESFMRAE